MNKLELTDALIGLGWRAGKDEVGEFFFTRNIDSVRVQLLPQIAKRPDYFRFSLNPSVSTDDFSAAISLISGEKTDFEPIIVGNEIPKKITQITTHTVHELSDQVIFWARNQNIDQGLEMLRNLPADSKGAFPLRHLAALSLAGDVEILRLYQRSFSAGDRCGFVPYITAQAINRALEIANR